MLFPRSLQKRETVHKPHGKTLVHTRTGVLPGSDHGVQLTACLGIHTGLVVVRDVGGSGRQEQLVLGETPNVAARLQGLAAPNTEVISAGTYRLLEGLFSCQPLGMPALKGVGQPLEAACVAPRAERIDASLDDPAEGPLMMSSWYLPSSWANARARLGTLIEEDVQVSMQARTEITHKPTTRPSERLVCAVEVTEGMASPGRTALAAYIFGLKCRGAELDALVLQRWWHLFYPHGVESARRSAPRLTDGGSVLEAYVVRPSLGGPCHRVDWCRRMTSARGCS